MTYDDFERHGIERHCIAAAIREAVLWDSCASPARGVPGMPNTGKPPAIS